MINKEEGRVVILRQIEDLAESPQELPGRNEDIVTTRRLTVLADYISL